MSFRPAKRALPLTRILHIFLLDFSEWAGALVVAVSPAKRALTRLRASALIVPVLTANRALTTLRVRRQDRAENIRDSNLRSGRGILTRCFGLVRASALVVSTFKADRASHLCNRINFNLLSDYLLIMIKSNL